MADTVDWNALAAVVQANFAATGQWFPGEPLPPPPIDWNAVAAQVQANFAATGHWFLGQFPPQGTAPVSLSDVASGQGGFIIRASGQVTPDGESGLGWTVAGVGDQNGDGRGDFVLGAPSFGDSGALYLVYGKADTAPVTLDAVAAGQGGWRWLGPVPFEHDGAGLSAMGDLNGDGRPDILSGAWNNVDPTLSQLPRTPGSLHVLSADGGSPDLLLTVTGGGPGFPQGVGDFGIFVAGGVDVNGDGHPDLLASEAGDAYVVFGTLGQVATSDVVQGHGGFLIRNDPSSGLGIRNVAMIPDLNGDGLGEVLLGGRDRDGPAAYVVWGKTDGNPVDLSAVAAGHGGFAILADGNVPRGPDTTVASIADLNGDGLPDILLGVRDDVTNTVAAYVVWGKTDGAPVRLSDVAAGHGGFEISGAFPTQPPAGMVTDVKVGSVGDLNGDGRAEILLDVVTNAQTPSTSYVIWGKGDGTPVHLSDIAAGHGGLAINADPSLPDIVSLSAVSDMNGDGRPEILVGAQAGGGHIIGPPGAGYVVFSSPDWLGAA